MSGRVPETTTPQDLAWSRDSRRRSNLGSFRMMTEFWPTPVASPRLRADDVLDEVEWLLSNGAMPWEVAQVLGRRVKTLSRLAYRHDRVELGTRLERSVAVLTAKEKERNT